MLDRLFERAARDRVGSGPLSRRGRVIARAGVKLDRNGNAEHRLKLPRRTKAGRYRLKATYKPAGGPAITTSREITLTDKRIARRGAASSGSGVALARGPRGLPDGRFHATAPRAPS